MDEHVCEICCRLAGDHIAPEWATEYVLPPCCPGCPCQSFEELIVSTDPAAILELIYAVGAGIGGPGTIEDVLYAYDDILPTVKDAANSRKENINDEQGTN